MLPTLRPGDRVLVWRRSGQRVRAGRLVVFHLTHARSARTSRTTRTEWMIKRVVAAGGDRLPRSSPFPPLGVVPPGALVVRGDNAAASYDSRHFGLLPAAQVLGEVVVLRSRLARLGTPADLHDSGT